MTFPAIGTPVKPAEKNAKSHLPTPHEKEIE